MELNTILNLLINYKLTADELLLVYLTFLAQDEEGHPEYFSKWFMNGGKENLKELFNSLKEKKIILKNYNPEYYNPNDIEFNQNFLKSWIKNSKQLGHELFEEYPPFLLIGGKYCPIRNFSKKFITLDDFSFYYSTLIGHSVEKHNEIMELLKWGKQNGRITFSILEFCASNKWLDLKLMKEGKFDAEIGSSFDLYDNI